MKALSVSSIATWRGAKKVAKAAATEPALRTVDQVSGAVALLVWP